MKKILLFLFSSLLTFNLFSNETLPLFIKMNKVTTKYFDVIYPDESEQTAFYLIEDIDSMYEKATDLLNAKKKLHLPVVICPCRQNINAHYVPAPYPHICVYDTLGTGAEDLLHFKQAMNEIFYHELIHAVSLTIQSEEVEKVFDNILPDFSYNNVFLNNSWKEGVTVSSESKDNFGRLNNGFTLSYIVQAKIEDKFPNFYEIASRDIYPQGKYPYLFGGAFSKYLQDTYGQDKYNDFFHQEKHFIKKAFQENYGKKIQYVWQDFKDSIPVPQLASQDCVKECYDDFSANLTSAVINGIPQFVYFSKYHSGIYTFKDGQKKAKKIINTDSTVSELSLSQDGRYLLITDIKPSNKELYRLRIYDMKKKRFTGKSLDRCISGEIININNKNYLACINIVSTDSSIQIYDFETLELLKTIPLKHFTEVVKTCGTDNKLAFIMRHEGKYFFNLFDFSKGFESSSISTFEFPEEIIPFYLNFEQKIDNSSTYIISTVGHNYTSENPDFPSALSRLARITVSSDNSVSIQFQKTDISGGVISPAYGNNNYYFTSSKAERKPISCFTQGIPGGLSDAYQMQETFTDAFEFSKKQLSSIYDVDKFKASKYMNKGFVLPYFMTPEVLSPFHSTEYINEIMALGIGYFTGSPAENFYSIVGGGYNLNSNSGTFGYNFLGGNKDFSFFVISGLNFKNKTNYNAFGELCLQGSYPLFTNNTELQYRANTAISFPNFKSFENINKGSLGLSLSKNAYMGTEGKIKGKLNATVYNELNKSTNIGVNTSLSLPQILPFNNPWGYTLNLPITIAAELIPDNDTFLDCHATTVLFGKEIQKQPGNSSLYIYRFKVTGGYEISWDKELPSMSILNSKSLFNQLPDMKNQQGITTAIHFEWIPSIGVFASSNIDCGASFTWYLKNEQNNKKYNFKIIFNMKNDL